MSALFASFTQGLLATNEAGLDQVLFWLAGSVQGRKLEILLSCTTLFSNWLDWCSTNLFKNEYSCSRR